MPKIRIDIAFKEVELKEGETFSHIRVTASDSNGKEFTDTFDGRLHTATIFAGAAQGVFAGIVESIGEDGQVIGGSAEIFNFEVTNDDPIEWHKNMTEVNDAPSENTYPVAGTVLVRQLPFAD